MVDHNEMIGAMENIMVDHGIQGGAPPDVSWFIIPITIDITP